MKQRVCVIGGMNFTVISRIDSVLQNDSSLFGEIKTRFGGVARNIALNLSKYKDLEIDFITVLSNDELGILAQRELDSFYVRHEKSLFIEKWKSYYCEIITNDGHYGINDMKMIENLSPLHIENIKGYIENHDILVIDTNISKKTLEYIASNLQITILCDATSDKKCSRIMNILDRIDTIKMNYEEACKLSSLNPQYPPNIDKLKLMLQRLPIRNCYVTLGEYGSFFLNNTKYYYCKPNNKITAKNVLGAGDIFCAEIIKGILNKTPVKSILEEGTKAAEKHLAQYNTKGEKP